MNGEKVWDKERCAFVFDHYAPCPDIKSAANHKEMREFAEKNDLRFHFDTNCGVCHQVMPEADSFARIFFRNAVNLGLVPVICKGISKKVKEGQTLTGISSYCFRSTIPHIIRLPPEKHK